MGDGVAKHNSGYKPETKLREAPPRVKELAGEMKLLCPFCPIPHPIAIGKQSPCGTQVKVTAVQIIVPARTVHKYDLKCIKCGKGGGEMTPFNNGYVHLQDCMPGTQLMADPPAQYSRLARFVYGLPEWIRKMVEARTGAVKRVDEIDPQGAETGKTLGYIFYKESA